MKTSDKLFIVDLTSVSFFSNETIKNITDSEKYLKIPFLFLISSYIKNSAINIAYSRLNFLNKKTSYDWDVYVFEKN